MPPRASFAIFSPSSCAPGATPSKPATLNRVCPAAIPATCVPCALLSNTKASVGTPLVSPKLAANVIGFDNNAHGTHVAGIAAGHTLFNVAGFDGVAPGAQLLGLKIANDARGGISMTGSIQHAMEYAARYAEQRHLPLVLNLSWGIGNEP